MNFSTNINGIFIILLSIFCIFSFKTIYQLALEDQGLTKDLINKRLSQFYKILIIWIGLISILSLLGIFINFNSLPPRLAIVLLISFIIFIIFSFTKSFSASIPHFSLVFLVGSNVYRILVEFMIYNSYLDGLMPIQMTYEGQNYDILTAISAPFVAYLIRKKNTLATQVTFIWNLLSFGLLINVITIAVLSFPGPTRYFFNEPSQKIVAEFPFVFLPSIIVVYAFVCHIIIFRKLYLLKINASKKNI